MWAPSLLCPQPSEEPGANAAPPRPGASSGNLTWSRGARAEAFLPGVWVLLAGLEQRLQDTCGSWVSRSVACVLLNPSRVLGI